MIIPVPLGAVKATFIVVEPDTVAVPMVGAPDIVDTDVDAPDATDVPPELVAVTVKV